jgi:putative DNA primase/helicase
MASNVQPSFNAVNIDHYRSALSIREACERFGIPVNGNGFVSCLKHSEKTPSMKDYGDHLYCHGCGAHLDLIGLVRHQRGCDLWTALSWIADECGLPKPTRNPEAQKRYEAAQSISDVYARVWQDALKNAEPGLAYLEGRGVSGGVTTGKVGYLPRDYTPPDEDGAKRAGLFSKKDNFLFADRLITPITHHGQIVSFYGRSLKEDRIPKHVYPAVTDPPMPGTLWNLDGCRNLKEIYLAECIIDAMTLVSHGISNVIALFGTQGLTDARLEALRRTAIEKITLCFDVDGNRSGQDGAMKTGDKIFRAGYDVRILELPLEPGTDKVDVNSYLLTHSLEDFRCLPIEDFFQRKLDTVPSTGTPREKYKALTPILQLVSEQPELTWKDYVATIGNRFPSLDKRKIEKEISQHRKEHEEAKEAGKRFLPLAFVEKIQQAAPVICFDGRYYRYGAGVYCPWHPEEVDQTTIGLIGPETQGSHLDAVRKFLGSVCFVRPETVNPRGLLNLKNGILELSSGTLHKHSPGFLFTVQSETSFNSKAECPLWLKTIAEILPDPESRALLAQVFGYCLTPDISQQKGFIFFGDGANGKSLVTDVLEALAGRDNCSALHLSDFKERFRLAELQNKLINFSTEVEAKGLVNDARLKGVITGDPLTAERKNQQPFVFRPFNKLIVSCNNLPRTTDKSAGYFRRWIIVPFIETFTGKKRDPGRARTIINTELSGVLNWAIGGYKSLMDAGAFVEPKASAEALQDYRRQTDPTVDFVEECLRIFEQDTGTPLQEIFNSYRKWTTDNGNQPLGRNSFYEALARTTQKKIRHGRDTSKFLPGVVLL